MENIIESIKKCGDEAITVDIKYADGELETYHVTDFEGIYEENSDVEINGAKYNKLIIRVLADKYLRKYDDETFEVMESSFGMDACFANDIVSIGLNHSNNTTITILTILSNRQCINANRPELCLRSNYERDENGELTGVFEIKTFVRKFQ